MTCREIFDFLMSYDAGELPVDELRAFENHLSVCPPCVAYLKSYRTTIALARAAGGDEADPCRDVPPDLVRAILAARRKAPGV
ncbi:hypothetical protein RAS1_23740 [Phycisphaerae bacterium RAS1]|nr:hypothetical protein RAS1_23740 [Phycisphaerae bacterium RAS1]